MQFAKTYQSHALTTIRGSYFRFAPNRTNTLFGENVCYETDQELITAFQKDSETAFLVVANATLGRPGSHAYKIWRYIEEQHIALGKYTLFITPLELLKACGFKKNGARYTQQLIALKQLSQTPVFYHARPFLKQKSVDKELSFQLLSVETNLKPNSAQVENFKITVDPLISIELKKRRRFYSINRDRASDLSPAAHNFAVIVNAALTRRFIKYLSTKEEGPWFYNKPYRDICAEWLGNINPHKNNGNGWRKHIEPLVEELINIGTLTSESCVTGGEILLYPGKGYFEDYSSMYKERFTDESRELVRYFGKKYTGGDNRKIFQDDYKYATQLIDAYGLEVAKAFIHHAVERAVKVDKWNDIKHLKVVNKYRSSFDKEQISKQTPVTGIPTCRPLKKSVEDQPSDSDYSVYQGEMYPMATRIYKSLSSDEKERIDSAMVKGTDREMFESLTTLLDLIANKKIVSYRDWKAKQAAFA